MGQFIVIEGLDGAGTTTQVERLCRALINQGKQVVQTCEPTDRVVGRIIRKTLSGDSNAPHPRTLPWMFAADRSDHLLGLVEPALVAGRWVVSDRYFHSSLAYQSLTLPLEEVWSLNRHFRAPDLTVFIDLTVERCLERVLSRGGSRDIYEHEQQLLQISAAYARVLPFLADLGHRIERVAGEGSVDEVAERVRALL